MSGVEHPQEVPADEQAVTAPAPSGGVDPSPEPSEVAVPAQRPGEVHDYPPPVDGPPGGFDDPAAGWAEPGRPGMRRGVHATTATELLLSVPSFLLSFIVMVVVGQVVAEITGTVVWLYVIVAAWLVSGPLALWRPVEDVVAVVMMRLRRPTLRESEVLDSAWSAVTRAAGVGGTYRLWVAEIDRVNAVAAAGRTVAVTRWALRLPPQQLEAILAHELGHHLAGHTWITFLGYWYSLPGRLARAVVWFLLWFILVVLSRSGWLGALLALAVVVGVGFAAIAAVVAFPPVLLVFALPFLQAVAMRRGELYADRVAARLGYGQPLVEVLYRFLGQGDDVERREAGWRERALAPHPPVASRIRALETYLRQLPS